MESMDPESHNLSLLDSLSRCAAAVLYKVYAQQEAGQPRRAGAVTQQDPRAQLQCSPVWPKRVTDQLSRLFLAFFFGFWQVKTLHDCAQCAFRLFPVQRA